MNPGVVVGHDHIESPVMERQITQNFKAFFHVIFIWTLADRKWAE